MYILFWTFLSIIFYSYLGYPLFLFITSKLVLFFKKNKTQLIQDSYEPTVTLFIAAFNEIEFVQKKIENSFTLNYPQDKINHVWVTDGSFDGTPEFLKKYDAIKLHHIDKRNGKIGAINRGMNFIKTPIVIFSDANTMLNKDAIRHIVAEFKNPNTGCVAGEKRIFLNDKDNAVNTGEGIYWRYESFIKKCESDINSALGAAGELFAIRTNLFDEIEKDTILDDFVISLKIARKGYKIKYAPKAFATERASINIKEELKRKTRIAYGGFQVIARQLNLLNPFKYPLLSFQYFSHKVLRWTIVPYSFLLIFIINLLIVIFNPSAYFYIITFILQITFYLLVLWGYLIQHKKTNLKLLFTPYYLFIMNLSEIIGFIKYVQKKQSINWERSKRE